jgi:hypothetical protein
MTRAGAIAGGSEARGGSGGRRTQRLRVTAAAVAVAALAIAAPGAAGQASFDYTFEMPSQPTLQNVHAVVRMDSTGRLDALIDYENRDELSPFCSGLVIGVYTADGTLLQLFTTPIRCTPAMGANGNNPGEPWKRHFTWNARLRTDYVATASIIDVRAVATGDVKVITDAEARQALEKRTSVVSKF